MKTIINNTYNCVYYRKILKEWLEFSIGLDKQWRHFSRPELRNSTGSSDCALIQFTLNGRTNKSKVGTNVLHFKRAWTKCSELWAPQPPKSTQCVSLQQDGKEAGGFFKSLVLTRSQGCIPSMRKKPSHPWTCRLKSHLKSL